MLQQIRNSRFTKGISLLLALQLFLTAFDLSPLYAGDGGPTQPEVHSFEPVGTNQMVDLFTGDFTYNIPLFNLPGPDGGYPINLAYHSGVQMDQEASWVGLGWNINMGTINRQVRNLPDDFGGEQGQNVTINTDMRPNWTVGVGGGATLETFGLDLSTISNNLSANLTLNTGVNITYNNYKGIGYNIDIGGSLRVGKKVQDEASPDLTTISDLTGDLGFNVKLDSHEGISSKYSFGVTGKMGNYSNTASVVTGFNTRTGWQRDLSVQVQTQRSAPGKRMRLGDNAAGSPLSFARPVVAPQIPYSMRGTSLTLSYAHGINVTGFFQKWSTQMFYSASHLKNRKGPEKEGVGYKGIGYMYLETSGDNQDSDSDYRLKDITRENEGLVHKNTRRLATPFLTYDVYSVTGQGIGNMFRPVRADVGTVVAPYVESRYYGGNVGVERKKVGNIRTGIDIGFNYSGSKTTVWPNSNALWNNVFKMMDASLTNSVYFQNYGEHAVDDIAANYGSSVATDKPVVYGLSPKNNFYDITNIDQNTNGNVIQVNTSRQSRKKRAVGVEAFTNNMIMDGNASLIPEFTLSYYATNAQGYKRTNRTAYDGVRSALPKSQVGGYVATNEGGMRYVYGLPAQNSKERDVTFSVKETASSASESLTVVETESGYIKYKHKGTDKYYNSIEKGTYSHAYMLTSILGQDYVDMDGVAGPSDGDLGYWVRFDYFRAHNGYKWRAPYSKALYDKGYETAFTDGKGRYSYGEKEIWYVATVETKTHIAEFIVSPRQDCRQVANEITGGAGSGSYYKLDRIDVYAKSERYKNGTFNAAAKPVQSCHFVYNYSLCKGTPDNNGTDGKLTLEKVYFTYRNNQAGLTRPYTFEYNTTVGGNEVTYNRDAVDRWGNYQPGANAANIDYPYIDPLTSKQTMDERAALWNIKAINLPSGGRYEIDYESDSYAYVQNEVAMQMFKIASLEPYRDINNQLISPTTAIQHPENAGAEHRKVYFLLEHPISETLSAAERKKQMERYIRTGEYLYFKVKINLTKNNETQEYVAGYTRVAAIDADLTSAVNGKYIWGCVTLDPMKVNGENTAFHPFTEAGARHIRYNQAQLLYDNSPNADLDQLSKSDIKAMGSSMGAVAKDMIDLFSSFTKMLYKDGNDRLSDVNLDKSYLRLRTPDKVKYGGGHRVREVRIIDNWASSFLSNGEATSVYGTVYEYDMEDENGEMISSGVAAYEPLVGGDEIPLRNPVRGWEDKNIASKTTAQTYTEEPGNESLFPGPTVGYRQVRVMSLNTYNRKEALSNVPHYAGITEHQFYTAKDYPVYTDVSELEQNKTFQKSRLIIPALIVNVDRLRMAATQGYYIELNDMHGKPKAAKEIAFNSSGEEQEIASVKYEYFDEERLTTNRAGETFMTRRLKNEVDVVFSDVDPNNHEKSDIRPATMATEVEFIPETRYHQSRNISAGLQLNFESVSPLVMFFPVPTFSWQEEKTGTVVTNKIVSKAGIMKKVTATQRGSVAETENLAFDELTGQPLLTSLTNDYGDPIYNYSIMAREEYDRTGPAYRNIGYSSIANVTAGISGGLQDAALLVPSETSGFVRGDVLLATPVVYQSGKYVYDASRSKRLCTMNIVKLSNNNLVLETATALNGLYRLTVIRSGRRNNLTSTIASITALSKPTENRVPVPCADDRNVKFTQNYELLTINNVLAITAVELGDHWYKDTRQLSAVPASWYDNAFFSKGFGGSYSPVRSYAYIDDRTQNTTGGVTDVRLRTDGVMNNVALFNWDRLQAVPNTQGCVTKWREVDQITQKNPSSFDIETRNILKTYSSSIYGRSGTEPIAVAGNARNSEIGTENFEEYAAGNIDITQNASNNLNFYTTIASPGTARYAEDRFDVIEGADNKATVLASVSRLQEYTQYSLRVHFDGYYDAAASTYYEPEEILLRITPSWTAAGNNALFSLPSVTNVPSASDRKWRGELFARKTLPNVIGTGNASARIAENKGHTGNKCLKIQGAVPAECIQARLALDEGKEYQFSGWLSTPNNLELLKNYDDMLYTPFKVVFYNAAGANINQTKTFTTAEALQGSFIDDWQKFTLNFTVPAGARYASIVLANAQEVYDAAAGDYTQTTYYDDLRLQPRDAAMQTYVYNQENQRLEAQLDDNNYATFYYYDDEGNLFLVKRETEKGIITVQESRNYLRKN